MDLPSIFDLEISLPPNKIPVAEARIDLKERLKELKLAPSKDGVMVCTTIERSDAIARNVSLQLIDGGTKPLLVFETQKIFANAPPGHMISIRKDYLAFTFEPNVNFSNWAKASALQACWWKEWKGQKK